KALLPLAFVAALATRAHADDHPSLEYVFDDGAVPLFWIPVVSGAVIDAEVSPRATPLGFDAGEGGATPSSWQGPGWALAAASAGSVVLIATSDDPSRWFHAKGLVEAIATSSLVVSIARPALGRRRADGSPTGMDAPRAESFPSGHATQAFA